MAGPAYKIQDLIDACDKNPSSVFVTRGAEVDARQDFGLNTKSEIIDFVAQNGLEDLEYKKTDPWENNPDPTNHKIEVDIYYFYSGNLYGYFAFLDNTITKKWQIKSFKKNNLTGPKEQKQMTSKLLSPENMKKIMEGFGKGGQNDK